MPDTTEHTRTMLVGRDADGYSVYARVVLRPDRPTPSPHETTRHERVETCTEVSITHETYRPGRRPADHEGAPYSLRHEPESLGASREPFRAVVDPADGWTREDLDALSSYGDRWHLNGMRSACSHQSVRYEDGPYGRRPSLTDTLPCPFTGYRYGSARLVEPLPAPVLSYFRAIVEHGRAPRWFVTRDDETLAGPLPSEDHAFRWILDHQGQSVDWATTHEGYAITAR